MQLVQKNYYCTRSVNACNYFLHVLYKYLLNSLIKLNNCNYLSANYNAKWICIFTDYHNMNKLHILWNNDEYRR